MNEWHDLLVAAAGASAALTGLIFVGISINPDTILSFPHFPDRAAISLLLQAGILIVSITLLIPNKTLFASDVEVLLISICTCIIGIKKGLNDFSRSVDCGYFPDTSYKRKQVKQSCFGIKM